MDSYTKAEKKSFQAFTWHGSSHDITFCHQGTLISELGIFTSKQTELKVQVHTSNCQKDFACHLGNINGPWATFYICCLDHSDLNSHFKNLNTHS